MKGEIPNVWPLSFFYKKLFADIWVVLGLKEKYHIKVPLWTCIKQDYEFVFIGSSPELFDPKFAAFSTPPMFLSDHVT